MRDAIDRMASLDLNFIYYGHFGMTNNPALALRQVADWLDIFMEEADIVMSDQKDHEVLAQRLLGRVREHLRKHEVRDDHVVYGLIELDMQVSAMGILDYLLK